MPRRPINSDDWPLLPYTDLPECSDVKDIRFRDLRYPLWTENKAQLIQRYIFLFLMITRHGTYIDGFAGPQEADKPEMWAAKLVLELEPKWLQHFYLFELNKNSYKKLKDLCDAQPPSTDSKGKEIPRTIDLKRGDFNTLIVEVLKDRPIKDKEATFCLLDQRTFECKWSTVKALAEYKPAGSKKIELFYFLPNSWLPRALAGLKNNMQEAIDWWGGDSVDEIRKHSSDQRRDHFCDRFKNELHYRYVTPWPIYEKAQGRGSIMYYMIHASDHDEAPKLMERAFHKAVLPPSTTEQPDLFPEWVAQNDMDKPLE